MADENEKPYWDEYIALLKDKAEQARPLEDRAWAIVTGVEVGDG